MKPHGHRTSIVGTPTFVCRGRGGHAPVLPQPPAIAASRNRSREAAADRNRELRRRALWLDCERAPLSIIREIPA
ncbi:MULTISPECIES: hypothetical protein [unclassified Sphingopyxis]|uniref:hypothetical protein n=1 Tax=unclassified Sphingopyxis TaxID=2614943 RepID=UPI0002D164B8|nr:MULTISPECIES: hypothetical protein [unclassified Sphingopyxis]ENY81894.1 hypothetical protein EBMC1_07895 [Sphingopyxis sp. MC1]KAB2851400.1 MAG: hypothetical protein F9K41_15925 [Sphingopyxis terrae]